MKESLDRFGQHENLELYEQGRRYGKALRTCRGGCEESALRAVAAKSGTSVAEVRTGLDFADAVDRIARIAGRSAKEVFLSGTNPLLTPKLAQALCRRTPALLERAMRRAALGRHPFAGRDASCEASVWAHYISQLHQASSCLRFDHSSIGGGRLNQRARGALRRDATGIRCAAAAVLTIFEDMAAPRRARGLTSASTAIASPNVRRARHLVEGVVRDLPLARVQHVLPSSAHADLVRVATEIRQSAIAILDDAGSVGAGDARAISPLIIDRREGPDDLPGTYVLVQHSSRASIQRIGRLGTFWLPYGFHLYVGSAMGGVRRRTHRHLDETAVKRWNIDHLKPFTRPIELWWTHHPVRVECAWAMALAGLIDFSCPIPGFGSNDCKSCPAHLYRSAEAPSCEAFTNAVFGVIPDHGPIFRQRLIECSGDCA